MGHFLLWKNNFTKAFHMSKRLMKWTLGIAAFSLFIPTPTMAQEKVSAEEIEAEEETEAGDLPALTIGSKAPSISVEHWVSDGHGKFKSVEEFEEGKVYVVEFWATWCGPCIASMPHLAETQEKYADKGVQIISISDEDLETVEGFLKRPVRGAARPKKVADAEPGDEEKDADAPPTYATLTSAYCLTTDPDGSVKTDYMEAAGQNGIPTSFIVGKSGLIEWIGHPMSMDEPLEQVVDGSWDRDAFLEEFKKEQVRDLVMTKLRTKMQKGDIEGALELLTKAKEDAAGDAATVEMYEQLEFRVKVTIALQQIQGDDVKEGMAALDELIESATEEQKQQLTIVKFNALVQADMPDDAAKLLGEIAESADVEPEMLNQLSWSIYESAAENDDFSKTLIDAAAAAAEKAAAAEPENGMILDTLAHLVYLQGDLDRAIELQTKAVENSDAAPDESKTEIAAFLKKLKKEKAGK